MQGLTNRSTSNVSDVTGLLSAAMRLRRRSVPSLPGKLPTRMLLRIRIPGASRWLLASNDIARGVSPGLRAILHCSCRLMRPRAGPVLLRQLDPDRWRLLARRASKSLPASIVHARSLPGIRFAVPGVDEPIGVGTHRPRRSPASLFAARSSEQTPEYPPRSSSSRVPRPFQFFAPAIWPIPSSILIVRALWKPRRFCRRLPHWAEY